MDKKKVDDQKYIIIENERNGRTIITGKITGDEQRYMRLNSTKYFRKEEQSEMEKYFKEKKEKMEKGNVILIKRFEEKMNMTFIEENEKENWTFREMKNPKAICAVSGCSIIKSKMKYWN